MKQADVVLLGYPVPFPLSPHVRRNNLEIYEAATSPQGPAMTWVRRLWGGGPHGRLALSHWPQSSLPAQWASPQLSFDL